MATPSSARPLRKARSATPKYAESDDEDEGHDAIEIGDSDDEHEQSSANDGDDSNDESSYHSSASPISVDSSFSADGDEDYGVQVSGKKRKAKRNMADSAAEKRDTPPAATKAKSEAKTTTPAAAKKTTKAAAKGKVPAAVSSAKGPAVTTNATAKTKTKTVATKKKKSTSTPPQPPNTLHESVDVVLPQSILTLGGGTGSAPTDCTVLVQIDPADAGSTLDFHGASGAIGRFEADDEGSEFTFHI